VELLEDSSIKSTFLTETNRKWSVGHEGTDSAKGGIFVLY
jgi:hypothetical protein